MRYHRLALIALLSLFTSFLSPLGADHSPRTVQRVAFGSCVHQDKPQPIWESIVAAKPDLFLFVGDNIYGDTEDMEVMKMKYDKLGNQPGYKKLLQTCPVLATWDDHDYGVNDGGLEYPRRAESQQVFLDFFGVPKDSPRRQLKGVYHAATFGPPEQRVQVILLDTRYHRTALKKNPKKIPGVGPYIAEDADDADMLGPEQWEWLEKQLLEPAKLRLVVSSIQVVPEDHGWEKWMNMPKQREKLYKLIRDTRAGGVVFLSGDRHQAELSLMDGGVGYPLYDLTSSGLNQSALKWRAQEINKNRVATMNFGNNFGMILIDWDQKDPLVRLQILDEEGEVTIQQKLPLSLLQPGAIPFKNMDKGPFGARLESGEGLTEAEIKKHLDKQCTVVIKVRSTGATTGNKLIFLNSAPDRFHEENFTVVLQADAQKMLKQNGIGNPREHFRDQTIQISGPLSLFQDRPQIIVTGADQIRVLKK